MVLVKMSSEEVKAEYTSSLADLTFNSKPLINVLTILAEESIANASDIVEAIETHLSKVHTDVKLPILYLIDCIVKNVGGTYTELFSQNIVSTFCSVFKVVDEKTRAEMFKLRQTWNDVFPQKKLYAIDVQIRMLDPAWPVTAQPPSNSIHFNPRFLKNQNNPVGAKLKNDKTPPDNDTLIMQQQLIEKQKELLELQQKKLELELLQTQVKLRESKTGNAADPRLHFGQATKKPMGIGRQTNLNQTKINPVNHGLIQAAKRPIIRDPRLQKMAENKIEGNKTNNKDPRLNNVNKNNQQKMDLSKPKSPQKSRQDVQKHNKTKSSKNGSDSSLKSSSNSSLESGDKKTEKNKSPTKTKRKDKYDDKKNSKSRKDDSTSPTVFKEIKIKNRDYLRRNRSPSKSPTCVEDEDLRSIDITEDKSKDVDLRQFPPSVIGGKKRPSTETLESNPPKKSKPEVFDALFGNEDTDLRKIPSGASERPPTPPPPIISFGKSKNDEMESPPKKNANLDVLRAKLANATNRDKIYAKSFHKRKLAEEQEQQNQSPQPNKIIISPQDEKCIKEGKMTKEQEKEILNKILIQVEKNKLREAKQKDLDISTHTISDEDMDISYNSDEEKAERERFKKEVYTPFNAKRGGDEEKVNRGQVEGDSVSGYQKFREQRWASGSQWRGGRRRHWDNAPFQGQGQPAQRPGPRPWLQTPNWRHIGPAARVPEFTPPMVSNEDEGKSQDVSDLVVANQDDIKTISIDGMPRDIRYYGEDAVIFMNWDDPRDISFQDGSRRVSFNDNESYLLSFNEPYKEVLINGSLNKIRLGVPSREIYINHMPYECYFGGAGITIDLNGVNTLVKLDGPPPQVKIGTEKRTDLVAGRVSLIINAKLIIPVFLDAKVQKFVLDGEMISLKFVDSLKTVLINDCPFNVEFGGLPKPVTIHDREHYIRFSVLPKGCKAGYVRIKDMEGQVMSPPHEENSNSRGFDASDLTTQQTLPTQSGVIRLDSPERNSNSPQLFQNLLQQNNLDVLSSVITGAASQNSTTTGGYQVENVTDNTKPDTQPKSTVPLLPSSVNINELFQKLVATGIVTTNQENNSKPPQPPKPTPIIQDTAKTVPKRNPLENLRAVSFARPETLKIRQNALYSALYSGMQCSSCGMRFPPEQSIHYSQHLDWHFRQNRKGKKNIRVASSRRWYYSLSDWKNYEEIEDLEEREKNFFDQQATQEAGAAEETEEEVEIPTVPSDPEVANECCEVCKDSFDQFFNEEKEEWHLRNALRMDDKTYHPVCYEDYLNSLRDTTLDETIDTTMEEPPAPKKEELIPGLQIILDDDDDDTPYSPEEVIIEESDDETPKEEEKVAEPTPEEMDDDGDDDDVILNEVAPVKIIVDDDDDLPDDVDNSPIESPFVKREKIEIDDGFEDVGGLITLPNGGGQVKIKAEPVDAGLTPGSSKRDELNPMEVTDPDLSVSIVENEPQQTHTGLITSIDGNVELVDQVIPSAPPTSKGIKINISKPLTVIAPREPKETTISSDLLEPLIDPSQPLPPGEEPVQLNLKPALKGISLKKMPPVNKGSELSGLCSIM